MKKILIISFLFFFFILYLLSKLPSKIKDINSLKVYDKNNVLIYEETNNLNKEWTNIEDINPQTIKALLFMEDKNFFFHKGYDSKRILKSLFNNVFFHTKLGGSTITQQLSKNLFLSFDKSIKRKISELYYSVLLENKYNKLEILESYLNTIYFSNNLYGITDASFYYYNKKPKDLTLSESICLFIITSNPSKYDPFNNYYDLNNKKNTILARMLNKKLISVNVYNEELKDVDFQKNQKPTDYSKLYFIDLLKSELNNLNIKSNNLSIYTDYDINTSNYLNSLTLNNFEHAIIILNKDGNIISTLGGNFYTNNINHVNINRPLNSLVKPFICYNSLVHGERIENPICTRKCDFMFNNELYTPSNHDDIYKDYSNMAYALSTSCNIYSCKEVLKYNITSVINTLNKLNLKTNDYLSLALGTNEDSLLNVSSAYYSFMSNGFYSKNHIIKEIYSFDSLIYKKEKNIKLLNEEAVKGIKSLLNLTFDENIDRATLKNYSTIYTKNTMAKTGSDDFNSWIIGFSDNYLVGIWNGSDEYKKISSSDSKYLYTKIYEFLNDTSTIEYNYNLNIYDNYYRNIYNPNLLPRIVI